MDDPVLPSWPPDEPARWSIMLPKEAGAARTARRSVDSWLENASPRTRGDAQSIVTELVASAAEFGRPPIWVTLERKPSHWLLQVTDAGAIERAGRGRRLPNAGWGFRIVDVLAESWGIEDHGSRVWCRLPNADATRADAWAAMRRPPRR